MQKTLLTLLAVLLLDAPAVSPPAQAQDRAHTASGTHRMTTPQEPQLLACNLGAMTPAQRQRHDRIGQRLRRAVREVQELPDGYAFRYVSDPALFLAAAEFVTLESRCCPFYHFSLEQEPRAGAIRLRVTGPKDAKSFVKPALAP